MNKPVRLLIADDHAIVRIGLTSLFESEKDITVVGQAVDGEDAVKKVTALHPDVVIMDLMMPKMDGAAATTAIKSQFPDTKIILLTTFGTSNGIARALAAGADGALTKTAEDAALVAAVRKVARGQKTISPEISRMLSEAPLIPELSTRQQEILASITRGLTNKDIAVELGISVRSVDEHVNAILAKIGAANRTEAVAIALKKQLLKI